MYICGWVAFLGVSTLWPKKDMLLAAIVTGMVASFLLINPSLLFLLLCGIGMLLGLIIEVGMVIGTRQQYWVNSSFWGIPAWLPIIWGYGFMMIYFLGDTLNNYLT